MQTILEKEVFIEQSLSKKLDAYRALSDAESYSKTAARMWAWLWEGGERRLREDEITQVRRIVKGIRLGLKEIEEVADRFEKINQLQ